MRRAIFSLVIISLVAVNLKAQVDQIGSGRTISFDGVNDYIDLGNIYDDLTFPVTISAWIFLEANRVSPIFVSQDNSPIYNGFQFQVTGSTISIEYGDGRGENNASFRRGKSASIPSILNRWVHVAAILRGQVDMDLSLNGINVGAHMKAARLF